MLVSKNVNRPIKAYDVLLRVVGSQSATPLCPQIFILRIPKSDGSSHPYVAFKILRYSVWNSTNLGECKVQEVLMSCQAIIQIFLSTENYLRFPRWR
jgi:hypothetical protein